MTWQTCYIFILDLFNQLHNSSLHRLTRNVELLHRTTRRIAQHTIESRRSVQQLGQTVHSTRLTAYNQANVQHIKQLQNAIKAYDNWPMDSLANIGNHKISGLRYSRINPYISHYINQSV